MKINLLERFSEEAFDLGDFYVYNVGYREVGSDWDKIGWFPYYRLYYIVESEDAFLMLRSTTVKLEAGHMYYIPAGQVVTGSAKMLKHSFIHFVPHFNDFDMLECYHEIIDLLVDKQVWKLFHIVEDCYNGTDISSRFAASGAIQLLLSMLLKNQPNNYLGQNKFLPVVDYINTNIGKAMTLEELAAVLNYNKRYFGIRFKEAFKVAPMQYVINKKITIACRLLVGGDLSVREIAFGLGFENEFYFSRIFKLKTGRSPTQYRQTERQSQEGKGRSGSVSKKIQGEKR